jgi:WD40 repeat protein
LNDIGHDEIWIWDWHEGTTPVRLELEACPLTVDWSPDGKQLLVSTHSSAVEVWDLATREKRTVVEYGTECLAWSPDSKWLAMANGAWLELWLAKGGDIPVYRRGQQSHISSIAWRPDGRELITGGYSGAYRWDVSDDPARRLDGQLVAVTSVAWSADGRLIAAGSENDLVQVWDAASSDPQWTSLVLADDQNITFNGAGQILHGDAETIERELVYLVENENGRLEVLKPSEFQQRIGQSIGLAAD